MKGRKNTSRANLNAANQEGRLQKWKEHLKNLLENNPRFTDKTIKNVTYSQVYIKLEHCCDEVDAVQKKLKAEKFTTQQNTLCRMDDKNMSTYFSDYTSLGMNKAQQKNRQKPASLFPQEREPRIPQELLNNNAYKNGSYGI